MTKTCCMLLMILISLAAGFGPAPVALAQVDPPPPAELSEEEKQAQREEQRQKELEEARKEAERQRLREEADRKLIEQEPLVYVSMETTKGTIYLELDRASAPISVRNFLTYVENKNYDGTVFHRVIDGFMIQGGGFNEQGRKVRTRGPIKNESGNGLSNVRGSIAMARTNALDSATNQFFINVVDNDGTGPRRVDLDTPKYAVFGQVVKGMDVVDQIRQVRTTTRNGMRDWPAENVVIKEVRKLELDKAKELGIAREDEQEEPEQGTGGEESGTAGQ